MRCLFFVLLLGGNVFSEFSGANACTGEISLSKTACGYQLVIGDRVIGKCLDKSSEGFKPLLSNCMENQSKNIDLNKSKLSIAELRKWMNCDGAISLWNCGCGYCFNVNTSEFGNGEHGSYTASCKSEESDVVKGLRSFCKRVSAPTNKQTEETPGVH